MVRCTMVFLSCLGLASCKEGQPGKPRELSCRELAEQFIEQGLASSSKQRVERFVAACEALPQDYRLCASVFPGEVSEACEPWLSNYQPAMIHILASHPPFSDYWRGFSAAEEPGD